MDATKASDGSPAEALTIFQARQGGILNDNILILKIIYRTPDGGRKFLRTAYLSAIFFASIEKQGFIVSASVDECRFHDQREPSESVFEQRRINILFSFFVVHGFNESGCLSANQRIPGLARVCCCDAEKV